MIEERRAERRGLLSSYSDPVYAGLRASTGKADSLIGTLGNFLVVGLVVAVIGAALFVALASHVRSGSTQVLDESVIRWLAVHHTRALDVAMLEITALGTGTVVLMIAVVAALFLVIGGHKYSAILLLASTIGGIVLNGVLKLGFDRPRPTIFIPAIHTTTSSFPSGHAMSAAIVYATVAYVAARLGSSLPVGCAGWRGRRSGLGWILSGDAGGYSEIRVSPRSSAPRELEGRVFSGPASPDWLFAKSLTSDNPATLSTNTWVSSSTLS